jgi:peptide/nickel transport system permease protein
MAVSVAAITLLPAGLGGALTGFLASRRKLWAESVADLLLLPADVLLFIPAVPGAIVIVILLGPGSLAAVIIATVVVLLPRAVRTFQTLWIAAPEQHRRLTRGLAGPGALFLGTLFAGLWLVAALSFLGVGIQPPQPSLGSTLRDTYQVMLHSPAGVLSSGIVLWLCTFACYTAADALIGFFHSKDVIPRLNE